MVEVSPLTGAARCCRLPEWVRSSTAGQTLIPTNERARNSARFCNLVAARRRAAASVDKVPKLRVAWE